jgi:hypothetical protein
MLLRTARLPPDNASLSITKSVSLIIDPLSSVWDFGAVAQCRQVEAANVIRRSQLGHGAESTRLAGVKDTNDCAGMGSEQ